MSKTFRQLLEDRIAVGYHGSAADFARATGFTPQVVSAWRKGRVSLPQITARRTLATELGVSHLELLVAIGELSAEEATLPPDPRSAPVRRFQPLIDAIHWTPGKRVAVENLLRLLADPEEFTRPTRERMEGEEG